MMSTLSSFSQDSPPVCLAHGRKRLALTLSTFNELNLGLEERAGKLLSCLRAATFAPLSSLSRYQDGHTEAWDRVSSVGGRGLNRPGPGLFPLVLTALGAQEGWGGGAARKRVADTGQLEEQKLIFSQFWKVEVYQSAGSVSSLGSLPGLQTATFSQCPSFRAHREWTGVPLLSLLRRKLIL